LATKCVCIANSIHYGIGSRDSVLTSGRPGSKHCSALKCTHGSDSAAYAVSGQPSAAYFWSLLLGLGQVRTARPSRGSQIAIRHPGEHTMLSYSTAYAVGSCSWFKSLGKRCSKNWVGYRECRTLPLGIRGAHNAQIFNCICSLVSIRYGIVSEKIDRFMGLWDSPSGRPGSKQKLGYSTAYAV
jgi:hypothetical protein